MMQVNLYDNNTIDHLKWPDTDNGNLAKQYIYPIIKKGTQEYFRNVSTNLQLIEVDGILLPMTINHTVEPNAYVCSTYTHYVLYALEEIKHIRSTILKKIAEPCIHLFGSLLKAGKVDQTVFVNNWLLPTNLYPTLTREHIHAITKELIKRFPNHTIAFRSVNDLAPGNLKNNLLSLNYNLLLCRDIYYTDTQSQEPFKARMTKNDFKILERSDYTIAENNAIPDNISERLAHLYQMLNIDKYSDCNPQYKPELLELQRSIPRFTLKAWMKEKEIHAVLGYYTQDGIQTSPLFGYDTSLPQKSGLYRQISTVLLKDAKEKKLLLHQSSGAGHYKQLRRAKKKLEYTAIYTKHLSRGRRLPWKLLLWGMNSIGKRILK